MGVWDYGLSCTGVQLKVCDAFDIAVLRIKLSIVSQGHIMAALTKLLVRRNVT
jgi:hypothetical protein